jgi:hypothetical protein
MKMGGMNDIRLHHQVLVDELSRKGIVGVNTTNPGGSKVNLVRLFFRKKTIDC